MTNFLERILSLASSEACQIPNVGYNLTDSVPPFTALWNPCQRLGWMCRFPVLPCFFFVAPAGYFRFMTPIGPTMQPPSLRGAAILTVIHAGKPPGNHLGQQSPFLREPPIGPPATVPVHFAPLRTWYHNPGPGSRTLLDTLHVRSTAQWQWQRQWLVLYSLVGLNINMYR